MPKQKPVIENVKRCPLCGGTVDRFKFHIECRDCGALGDPYIGMMQSISDLELSAREGNHG